MTMNKVSQIVENNIKKDRLLLISFQLPLIKASSPFTSSILINISFLGTLVLRPVKNCH